MKRYNKKINIGLEPYYSNNKKLLTISYKKDFGCNEDGDNAYFKDFFIISDRFNIMFFRQVEIPALED